MIFTLLFQTATSNSLAVSPWLSFLISMLALGLAVYGARMKNAMLSLGAVAVAFIFGAVAAYSTDNAIKFEKQRAEMLSVENNQLRVADADRQADYNALQAERDSFYNLLQMLPAGKNSRNVRTLNQVNPATTGQTQQNSATKQQSGTKTTTAKGGTAKPTSSLAPSIRAKYLKIGKFRDGLAAAKSKNGKWGYIDTHGNVVTPAILRFACEFHNGMAGVKNDEGLWGYVNKLGQLAIEFQFDYAFAFEKNKEALVQKQNNWFWINTNGATVRNAKTSDWQVRVKNMGLASR